MQKANVLQLGGVIDSNTIRKVGDEMDLNINWHCFYPLNNDVNRHLR
jgi:hypothetical protein